MSKAQPGVLLLARAIIVENEAAARVAFERGDYVLCFLLLHALAESLLRAFLGDWRERGSFAQLVTEYGVRLRSEGQTGDDFVKELTDFNRRRNRVIHELWRHGYGRVNRGHNLKAACEAGALMYGLFIEWLETFDPEICAAGFRYER